ncbi:MAG: C1 family peptidase, partial [Parahaliea sp.]
NTSGDGAASRRVGLGYHPDLPDMRDFVLGASKSSWNSHLNSVVSDVIDSIKEANARLELAAQKKNPTKKAVNEAQREFASYLKGDPHADPLPQKHDLRLTGHFTPVEDQGELGSCTAQAVIGLVEYLMRAGGDLQPDMSRLFLYKTSRKLLGWNGDTGAYLRTTIKAMALFGVPPESENPYIEDQFDAEPDAYLFAFAQNFKASVYARLDGYGSNTNGVETLDRVKRALLDGFPVTFGFPVYSSIDSTGPSTGYVIPIPRPSDRVEGGHAVLAVGYDDNIECGTGVDGRPAKGALIIRNSWGAEWGMEGYAYFPYEYVEQQWAVDFWTIFNRKWLKLENFA